MTLSHNAACPDVRPPQDGVAMAAPVAAAAASARQPTDLPSLAFLALLALNTCAIGLARSPWTCALLALPQALLLGGCQEAKHQCVHRAFLRHAGLNDAAGTVLAALAGLNFTVYRFFHLQHHRHTCDAADPEGALYGRSWRSRVIWLLAPLEVPWVAFHILRAGWSLVPPGRRARRALDAAWCLAFGALVLLGVRAAPHLVLWAYAIPAALNAWFDFPLTQAEHYGVPVIAGERRRDPAEVTLDILLPPALGWLHLHRSLHRVHHRDPATRWYEAPRRLRRDPGAAPMTYLGFVRRWWAEGPRLWLPEAR